MFDKLVIRGATASILWGYRTAAQLQAWTITKEKDGWILRASVEGMDRFQIRRSPLIFTSPRHYGMCCWPVIVVTHVGERDVVMTLGEPEQ